MNNPVKTSKIASKYSIIFLILVSLIINLIEDPKSAHIQIEGMQTNGAVPATNIVAIIKFSSVGKNPDATVNAIDQAFGFINWKKKVSINFTGFSFLVSSEFVEDAILYAK